MPIPPRAVPLAPLACLVMMVTGSGAFHVRAEEPSAALAALAEAERSFARASVEMGIRDSFLAFFAEDGIAFQPAPRPAFPPARAADEGKPDPEAARTSLAEAERAFARELAETGAEAAYAARLDPAARMNRQGLVQLAGAEAIRAHLGKQEGKLTWEPPLATGIARSADLAYTYGRYQRTKPGDKAPSDAGYYVHVWRRTPGGDWKLVFDTESPLPPERAT